MQYCHAGPDEAERELAITTSLHHAQADMRIRTGSAVMLSLTKPGAEHGITTPTSLRHAQADIRIGIAALPCCPKETLQGSSSNLQRARPVTNNACQAELDEARSRA